MRGKKNGLKTNKGFAHAKPLLHIIHIYKKIYLIFVYDAKITAFLMKTKRFGHFNI